MCESEIRAIISGLPYEQYLIACGKLQSKLEVLALPDTLTMKAKEIDDHTRPAANDTSLNHPDAFVGGPWFKHWERLAKRATGTSG